MSDTDGWKKTEYYSAKWGQGLTPKRTELAQTLFDTGLLFLVNQSVLHHYGLALGVDIDEGQVVGLTLHQTDDPNGIWFDEATVEASRTKLRAAGFLGSET